jgi:hypothetical protein
MEEKTIKIMNLKEQELDELAGRIQKLELEK